MSVSIYVSRHSLSAFWPRFRPRPRRRGCAAGRLRKAQSSLPITIVARARAVPSFRGGRRPRGGGRGRGGSAIAQEQRKNRGWGGGGARVPTRPGGVIPDLAEGR